MSQHNKELGFIPKVLATDLDGTLIPLPGSPENHAALAELRNAGLDIIFCTGRHLSSVLDAISRYDLPEPSWFICDVGSSIYRNQAGRFQLFEAYARHLEDLTVRAGRTEIESLLEGLPGLGMQQEDHQGTFKISYECVADLTDPLVDRISRLLTDFHIPYAATGSVDPFLKCGLIDLLPEGVSKAYALKWLANFADYKPEALLYAGDSGNDYPALTAGWPAIVVANASPGLADKVKKELTNQNQIKYFFHANQTATSGVLDGCKYFGWI
jgi:HAD superfamily hydrolase (TIGR01484 family)